MKSSKRLCRISIFAGAFFVLSSAGAFAQDRPANLTSSQVARAELPDSPGAVFSSSSAPLLAAASIDGQSRVFSNTTASPSARTIKPWQTAPHQTAGDKVVMSLKDVASLQNVGSSIISAGWSHLWDTRPHYGTDSSGFAERFGASMLKGSTQTISRDAIYGNLFHEDTRYYIRGRRYGIKSRAIYAATRVFVTKKDAGGTGVYYSNIASIATSNALANLYYPTRDQGAGQTAQAFAMGFATNVLSNELKEFMGDAIALVFHKKQQ